MKKKILFLCVSALMISLVSCKKTGTSSSVSSFTGSSSPTTSINSGGNSSEKNSSNDSTIQNTLIPDTLKLHFKTETKDLSTLAFWFWSDTYKPEVETLPTGTDDYGIYVDIDIKPFLGKNSTSMSFLVKEKGSWSYQTSDILINFKNYVAEEKDGKIILEIYANALTKSNIELSEGYDPNAGSIIQCNFKTKKSIYVKANKAMKSYKLYAFTKDYYVDNPIDDSSYIIATGSLSNEEEIITLEDSFSFISNVTYKLRVSFQDETSKKESLKIVDSLYLYKHGEEYPYYSKNDLGLTFDDNNKPIFKVFAPTSTLVQLNIYTTPYSSKYVVDNVPQSIKDYYDTPKVTIPLDYDNKTGVHSSINIDQSIWDRADIKGLTLYYTYTVYNQLGKHEVMDPYAYASGLNSERGAIIDLSSESVTPEEWKNLPKVWDKDPTYDIASPCDLVISEQHIRDLTDSDTWSNDPSHQAIRGTYKAFYQEGTTYTKGNVTVKTGFDHLVEYGVNAIQLQPIYDQDNNEMKDDYNWGYNPLNYNIPEGQYASDSKPTTRIKELRELVAKYATSKNHMRIIMDVVYNHVSRASNSNFELLVPGYYFRTNDDGEFLDNSGCGNEVKSEAPMMRKFIVDSVCHWAKNYLIKGFRFDLMAIIDKDTMKAVKEALYEIDPDIVVYGEGWDATGAYYNDPNHANASVAYSSLYHSSTSNGMVGAFNDSGRNALKGGNSTSDFYGFISQGAGDLSRDKVNTVSDMIKGIATGKGANPHQTINYASCHDNYTLFDQLNYTLSKDGGKTEPDINDVARASVAVNGVVILSNGVSFINGGEEIFRTKIETDPSSKYTIDMYGKKITHNSYKSSVEVNAYDYSRKVDLLEYYEMYVKLINIRKNLAIISFPDNCEDPQQINTWDTSEGTTISAYRKGKDGKKYHFFINGRSSISQFGFDSKNGNEIFTNGVTFSKNSNGLSVSSKYSLGVFVID